jgi:hypothetical protein
VVKETVFLVGAVTQETQGEARARQRQARVEITAAVGDGQRAQAEAGSRDAGHAGGVRLLGRRTVANHAAIGICHVIKIAASPPFDFI